MLLVNSLHWDHFDAEYLLLNIAYIQNSRDCTNIFLPVHRLRSAKYRKIDKVRSILQIRGDKSTTVVLFFQGEQLDSSAEKLRTPFLITLSFYNNICHQFWLIKTTFAPLLFSSLCKNFFIWLNNLEMLVYEHSHFPVGFPNPLAPGDIQI